MKAKFKDYAKELSLTILGVLIALLIDNYRENKREREIIRSYLDIVAEDLNFDIENIKSQLKWDSVSVRKLKYFNDILITNRDLPFPEFGLSNWRGYDSVAYRNLATWDSLDYYSWTLYSVSSYKIRQIGFAMITNSELSHQVDKDLLKKMTIYYTTDSQDLDMWTDVDERCLWNGIPFFNRYQGFFKERFRMKDFLVITELRNHVGGRHNTMINEMAAKHRILQKATLLHDAIKRETD